MPKNKFQIKDTVNYALLFAPPPLALSLFGVCSLCWRCCCCWWSWCFRCFCFGRLFRLAWVLGCRPCGAARWSARCCLSGWLFGVLLSCPRRALGLRRIRRLVAGFALGLPCLGASLPGWAVLAAACPVFFWLAPSC